MHGECQSIDSFATKNSLRATSITTHQVPTAGYCINVVVVCATLPRTKSERSTNTTSTSTNWNAMFAGSWWNIRPNWKLTWNICMSRSTNRFARNAVISQKIKSIDSVLLISHFIFSAGKVFQSKTSLVLHEESDCGKTPGYKCEHCGKCLVSLYTLRAHIEVMHANTEKKFVCSYCGKAWHSKAGLASHLRNHTGEKPYKCDYCERRFAARTSKMTHETTHTGIKPYMCQCGDRFSCISNLQSHRKARKNTCGLLPLISKRFPDKITSINLEPVWFFQ